MSEARSSLVRRLREPLVLGPILSLLLGLSVLGLRGAGAVENLELELYDAFIRFQVRETVPDPRIVIIGITDADMDRYGFPLPDAVLAELLEILHTAGPRGIGVDLYRTIPVPPGEERLRKVVTENPDVIVMIRFAVSDDSPVNILGWLKEEAELGFVDQRPDPGGKVRRAILYLWEDGQVEGSLALQLALRYLDREGITQGPHSTDPENGLALGATELVRLTPEFGAYVDADTAGFQYLMDYAQGLHPFSTYSVTQILTGQVDAEALAERVILIGVTSETVKDHLYTPFSRGIGKGGQTLYGVEIHAQQVSQLLRFGLDGSPPVQSLSQTSETVWILAWTLLGGLLGLWRSSAWVSVTALILGLALLGGGSFLLFGREFGHWWLPVVPAGLGAVSAAGLVFLYASSHERGEREFMMRLFGKFTGAPIAENIWENREQFMDGGRIKTQGLQLTIMMTDLKGFTGASEGMSPAELMDWVNEYMEIMAGLVEEHGGVVDDYAGDGIKANWGVPIPRESEEEIDQDAIRAVECALAMGDKMAELNETWKREGRPTGRMRVGIHTGPAVVGLLGSQGRLKYTSVGDTVNTAARLETFDKEGFAEEESSDFRILVGEETFRRLGSRFPAEPDGAHALRGKEQNTGIFRIYAANPEGDPQ